MKPTPDELHIAMAEATRLRAANQDSLHLAKTILYQQLRLQHLEEVYLHADRLVRFGLDEHEHARLIKALDAARRAEEEAGGTHDTLGLS